MGDKEEQKQQQHQHQIVMLPYLAQGHLIPFLALANQIHRSFPQHFAITIATTSLNARYLASAISNNNNSSSSSSPIHLHELPFNSSDHNLPPNTQNSEALPLNQIINLFRASASLEPHLRRLIHDIHAEHGAPPVCIISDVFMGWANGVGRSCGTKNVTFTTGGAYGTSAYMSLWQHLPHRGDTNMMMIRDEFNLPGFPDSCVFHVTQLHRFLRNADGSDSWSTFFRPQIEHSLNSSGWLCNTAGDIEPLGLDVLRKYTNLPVWCIGPLLPPTMVSRNASRVIGQHAGRVPGVSPERCLEWLDLHSERSVLYISFGSQNTISPSQMMALALGLEDSEKSFVWVIRPPTGFNSKDEFKPEWLPPGFEERVAGENRGLVVHGWAPQLEILCHKSIAAFVSHCGWNSVMESLSQGVPIIGWPLAAEQGYNAKMLVEEMGVCVEMTRGLEGGISKEKVKEVIETVMGGGSKAEEMKRKAEEIGEMIREAMSEDESHKGSSLKAMEDFVSAILPN